MQIQIKSTRQTIGDAAAAAVAALPMQLNDNGTASLSLSFPPPPPFRFVDLGVAAPLVAHCLAHKSHTFQVHCARL